MVGDAAGKVLQKLAPKGSATWGSLRSTPEVLTELTTAELVAASPGKRGVVSVTITAAGRELAEKLAAEAPPPKPARAPRAATAGAGTAAIEERLARIEAKLDQLQSQLIEQKAAAVPARPIGEVKTLLLDTIAELDSRNRYGGLVPIPEIRRAVQRDIAYAQVTEALEALEHDYVIDLNIAQQPTSVPPADRYAGIERPGRGLLYYVARRAP